MKISPMSSLVKSITIITLERISDIHYPERNVIMETPRIVEKQLVLHIQHV